MVFRALQDLAQVCLQPSLGESPAVHCTPATGPLPVSETHQALSSPESLHLLVPLLECSSFSSIIEQLILILQETSNKPSLAILPAVKSFTSPASLCISLTYHSLRSAMISLTFYLLFATPLSTPPLTVNSFELS